MNSESKVIVEIWDLVRDHIPNSRKSEIAISILQVFEEYGFDEKDMLDILDEDKDLKAAYEDLYGLDEEENEDYDDYED